SWPARSRSRPSAADRCAPNWRSGTFQKSTPAASARAGWAVRAAVARATRKAPAASARREIFIGVGLLRTAFGFGRGEGTGGDTATAAVVGGGESVPEWPG